MFDILFYDSNRRGEAENTKHIDTVQIVIPY